MKISKLSRVVEIRPGVCQGKGKCVFSGKEYATAEFPKEAYISYRSGAYIQDALHMLSDGDREFILSGISPAAWDETFSESEEESQEKECDCLVCGECAQGAY